VGAVSTRLFPDRGGPATFVSGLSLALKSVGIESTVVASAVDLRRITPNEDRWMFKRIPVKAPAPQAGLIRQFMYSIAYFILATLWGVFWFGKRRVDVIDAHSPPLSSLVGFSLSRLMRVPLVITLHGMVGPRFSWSKESGSRLNLRIERVLLKSAASVIAVTTDYIPIVKKLAPDTPAYQIGSGVDTVRFSPPHSAEERMLARRDLGIDASTQVLLWVGNFDIDEKVKGVVDLLRATKILRVGAEKPLLLLLVGSGKARNRVEELAAGLGLADRVRFVGQRSDVPKLMRMSDVFVLVSHHEGSPSALLEAMATGLPCIASRIGDIPRLLGDAGLLVAPGDIDDLASKMRLILCSPDVKRELSQKSRSRAVMRFSWNQVARQTAEVYFKAVQPIARPKGTLG